MTTARGGNQDPGGRRRARRPSRPPPDPRLPPGPRPAPPRQASEWDGGMVASVGVWSWSCRVVESRGKQRGASASPAVRTARLPARSARLPQELAPRGLPSTMSTRKDRVADDDVSAMLPPGGKPSIFAACTLTPRILDLQKGGGFVVDDLEAVDAVQLVASPDSAATSRLVIDVGSDGTSSDGVSTDGVSSAGDCRSLARSEGCGVGGFTACWRSLDRGESPRGALGVLWKCPVVIRGVS